MRDDRTTLVLVAPEEIEQTWRAPGSIVLTNYALLDAALHAGVTEYGREVARVVFDRSVSAERFLTFLSTLPIGFRGDVLYIQPSGGGFLSAVSRDDGRYLYSLTARDVAFYRETTLAAEQPEAVEREARSESWSRAS